MMTSTSKFSLGTNFPSLSSRDVGDEALGKIVAELEHCDVLEIDFEGRRITPSFADQCIGGLARTLGLVEFKRRIKIRNADEDSISLIKHVILSRASLRH